MIPIDSKLHDEAGRMAALQRYQVLDTPKEQPFDRITGLIKTVLNVPMCAVSLIDTDRQWFKSCVGLDVQETARDISFCTHTIQKREAMNIPDALLDERFRENPLVTGAPFIRSYLGVPLSSPDGYNVGSLCAIDSKPRDFTGQHVAVLSSFAALVVDELELRRIAETDHLTGVATRRSFTADAEKALAQDRETSSVSGLLMLDIDHFKSINDTFGHPTGDVVLKAVADQLKRTLSSRGTIGRLGGEEFGILLRDVDEVSALATAERLRSAIEAMQIDHDPPLNVTASFGLALADDATDGLQEWLARADSALYEAKRGGRNRCCVAVEDSRAARA